MSRRGLTVLATSDLHGARVPELEALQAAAHGPCLTVDNGDAFGGLSGLAFASASSPRSCDTLAWFGALGVAAMNLGNHDVDGGLEALRERAGAGGAPLLCGNLRQAGEAILPSALVHETDAGVVGVVGALTPAARGMWVPGLRRRLRLEDPVACLVEGCRALRTECDFVVALGHLGLPLPSLEPAHPAPVEENPGDALVAALSATGRGGRPLADCVVLGHTHVQHAAMVARTAVVIPGCRGEGVARVRLGGDGAPLEVAWVPLPGTPQERLARATGPVADLLREEDRRLRKLARRPLRIPPGATTFADQALDAVREVAGASGLLLAAGALPEGPPARTVSEALARSPMQEPLVALRVTAGALASFRAHRAWHAERAPRETNPRLARRHRWHAFLEVGVQDRGEQVLLVPAAWAGGYGGYSALRASAVVADPGRSLVEFLLTGNPLR